MSMSDLSSKPSATRKASTPVTGLRLILCAIKDRSVTTFRSHTACRLPKKKHQEERPLLLLRDGFKRIMITKDFPAPHYNNQGVLFMDLFDFLLDSNSLRR